MQKPAKQILAEMSNTQKKACWAQFVRTFITANERGARDAEEKCPAELMLTVISQQEKKTWYNIWMENGMKWSRVRMSEQFKTTDRQVDGSIHAWLTESQICDLYKCETTAAEIVKMKEQRPQMWRPHPEIPHIKEARQFYCLVRQELRKELENIKSRQVDWSADIEAEAARHLSQQIAPTTDSTPDGIARIAVAHDALPLAAEEKEKRAEQLDPEKQAAAAAVAAAAAATAEKARKMQRKRWHRRQNGKTQKRKRNEIKPHLKLHQWEKHNRYRKISWCSSIRASCT